MDLIKQFNIIFFLLYILTLLKIKVANGEVIKGLLYNYFPEYSKNVVRNKIIESYKKNSNIYGSKNEIEIVFSSAKKYEDYLNEVKRELINSNYHFFLISSTSLFDEYAKYQDLDFYFSNGFLPAPLYDLLLPIDKYTSNIDVYNKNINDIFYEDYKMNNNRYGLPFSASYNYLFYNKQLLSNYNITVPENNIKWEDIEAITETYNKNNPGNPACGLVLSLNNQESMVSLFLEGLFAKSKDNNFKDCKEYNDSDSNYRSCGRKNPQFFYGDTSASWISKIRSLYQNNIICQNSLNYGEKEAYNNFISGKSLFFKGNSDSYQSIYNRNKFNGYGTIKLPNYFTSYGSLVLVGNGINGFKSIYGSIAQTIKVLASSPAQIIRANNTDTDFSFTPTFNFTTFRNNNKVNETSSLKLVQQLPYEQILTEVNPISLITSMRNSESTTNSKLYNRFHQDMVKFLKDEEMSIHLYINDYSNRTKDLPNLNFATEYRKDSLQYKNLNILLTHLYYYLNITYTKWSSGVGIMSLIYFIIGNVYAFTLAGLIYYNRDRNKMIKKASPKVCIAFIIGVSANFDYAIFHNGLPSVLLCTLEHYFMYIFITTALLAYLKRVWNILYLFKDSKTSVFYIKITRFSFNTIITVIITIELVLNILWDLISRRTPDITEMDTGERYIGCWSVFDTQFSLILEIINIGLFIFVFVLSLKTRKAHDYYDEYKACVIATVAIIVSCIFGITVAIYAFVNFKHSITEICRSTLSFLIGMIALSFIVLPKLVEALSGKSLFAKVYKNQDNYNYPSSDHSFNKMIFNSNNMNVITFRDAEEEYDPKIYNEKLVTPLDNGFSNRRSKNSTSLTGVTGSNRYSSNSGYFDSNSPIMNNNGIRFFDSSNVGNYYEISSSPPKSKNNDIDYLYGGFKDIEPRLY